MDKAYEKQYSSSSSNGLNSYPSVANLASGNIVGAYQNFTETNDSIFMATINHLLEEY
jgi:hypothetical protein